MDYAENQRRLANLQGIIKWSMRQMDDDPSSKESASSEYTSMDEETKQWLQEALTAMSDAPSETDLLKASLAVLKVHHRPAMRGRGLSEEEKEAFLKAADDALYFIEDLDHANDLIPLGGVEVVGQLLDHAEGECRRAGCELIGTAVQNNPKTQSTFLPYLPGLLALAGRETEEGDTRVKAFFAISCMIRENEVATSKFFELGGIDLMCICITSDVNKLQVKALFLLRNIVIPLLQVKGDEVYGSMGKAVSDVIVNFQSGQVLEMALSAEIALVKASPIMTESCRQDGRLTDALRKHAKELKLGSDELKYCLQLLHAIK